MNTRNHFIWPWLAASLLATACGRSPTDDNTTDSDAGTAADGTSDASADSAPCDIDGLQEFDARENAYLRGWGRYYSEALALIAACDTGRPRCRADDRVFEELAPHCYDTEEEDNGPLVLQASFMCREEIDWQLCTFEHLDDFRDCVENDCTVEECRVHIDTAYAACGAPPPQLIARLEAIARETPP